MTSNGTALKFDCGSSFRYGCAMQQHVTAPSLLPQPKTFAGTFRRFGPTDPFTRSQRSAPNSPVGDRLMRIRVAETGEELNYRLSSLLDDPVPH